MPTRRVVALILIACLGWTAEAGAQFGGRASLSVHDRYIWRGIRRADGGNAQLEAGVHYTRQALRVAAGLWSNVELSTHRDGQLTELRPGRWGMSEANGWLEVSGRFDRSSLAGGFVWYQYHLPDDSQGTGEVYARWRGVLGNRFRVSPELSAWYDIVKRKSGYIEAGLTAPILALPFLSPAVLAYTSATAGVALGHPDSGPRLASSWFSSSGFTHADFAAGMRLRAGLFHLNLAGHLFRAGDPATRRKVLDPSAVSSRLRVYLSLESGLSWSSGVSR